MKVRLELDHIIFKAYTITKSKSLISEFQNKFAKSIWIPESNKIINSIDYELIPNSNNLNDMNNHTYTTRHLYSYFK